MPTLPAVKRFVSGSGVRIYRIPCQVLPNLNGLVYLLLEAGPPTLIDVGSGRGQSTQNVLDGLETVRTEFGERLRPRDIKRIVLTHGHIDHVGGLPDLLGKTHAQVGIHALDCRSITAWDEQATLRAEANQRFLQQAGIPARRAARLMETFHLAIQRTGTTPVDFTLDDNSQVDGLRFIHTPGHAPGHVVIAVDDVLFSGDHILPSTVPQLWPESIAAHTGLGHYLNSLDKIGGMGGFDIAMGGHEPVMRDVYKRIAEIRECHLQRLERVLDMVRKATDPITIAEIARQIYPNAKGFYAFLALCDVGARTEHLLNRGETSIANLDEIKTQPNAARRYRIA